VTASSRLGVTAAVLFAAGGSLFTHVGITATRPQRHDAVRLTVSEATPSHQTPRGQDGAAVDLYGNEVSDAIATYSLDPAGSLYELHSPQTELPRLGAPKS
jgi:hypothetical protein